MQGAGIAQQLARQPHFDAAASKFNEVGVRTRAIQKKLRDVEGLHSPAPILLADAVVEAMP